MQSSKGKSTQEVKWLRWSTTRTVCGSSMKITPGRARGGARGWYSQTRRKSRCCMTSLPTQTAQRMAHRVHRVAANRAIKAGGRMGGGLSNAIHRTLCCRLWMGRKIRRKISWRPFDRTYFVAASMAYVGLCDGLSVTISVRFLWRCARLCVLDIKVSYVQRPIHPHPSPSIPIHLHQCHPNRVSRAFTDGSTDGSILCFHCL